MIRRSVRWVMNRARDRVLLAIRTRRTFTITAEGVVFVVVTLLIGIAAMNTSAQLLFLVFSLMCSFWMLSAVLATSSMRYVGVSRVAPRLVTARRPVAVRIKVRNKKLFSGSHSLRVIDLLENKRPIGAVFFPRIPNHAEAETSYQCVFPRRGLYNFDAITVATRFPFGLIERAVTRPDRWEILVLPAIIPVDSILQSARVDLGDQEVNVKGQGSGLFGIREYQRGESSRDIHWRVSARTGKLMVREFESEERRRASVLLDNRLPEKPTTEDIESFEQAVVLCNSVLGFLIERGHQVELLTASGKIAFDSGANHLLRCRRALAALKVEHRREAGPMPHLPEADSVQFWISHRTSRSSAGENAVVLRTADHEKLLAEAIGREEESGQKPLPGIEKL